MTYLLLGKRPGGCNLELLDRLLPDYIESLKLLEQAGAEWVQLESLRLRSISTMLLAPLMRRALRKSVPRRN
jgi:hypothetical protein